MQRSRGSPLLSSRASAGSPPLSAQPLRFSCLPGLRVGWPHLELLPSTLLPPQVLKALSLAGPLWWLCPEAWAPPPPPRPSARGSPPRIPAGETRGQLSRCGQVQDGLVSAQTELDQAEPGWQVWSKGRQQHHRPLAVVAERPGYVAPITMGRECSEGHLQGQAPSVASPLAPQPHVSRVGSPRGGQGALGMLGGRRRGDSLC